MGERPGKRPLKAAAAACAAVAALVGGNDGAAAGDKSLYTLFNPTPADQLRDMDTDRPNETNTPHTIDAGHVQIETGFFDYTDDQIRGDGANGSVESLTLGHFNVRYGVLNNLEVNAAVDSFDILWTTDHLSGQSTRQQGFGDTVLGGKLNLWGNDAGDSTGSTALAIQPQVKLPTAQQDLGNGHTEGAIGVPLLVALPAGFHLGLETAGSWERNVPNTGYVAGWQNSASLDRVVVGDFDVYVEYWSHVTTESHQQPQQTADVGFTYPIGDNVVLDTGVNLGLDKAANTFEWVGGISVRF